MDLLVEVDNVFKNKTAIVLNNGISSLILGFPDIKKLGLQIIEGEVFTRERQLFGHDLPTEIETVQTYKVNVSQKRKNSALNLEDGIFETASSEQITSENGLVPEIIDDFTMD